jgi:8-oxo-dGTP pyrophosphatase MutT (NUDIX family)
MPTVPPLAGSVIGTDPARTENSSRTSVPLSGAGDTIRRVTQFGSLPPGWAERVEALANGSLEPVPPRPSATILLLRDRPDRPGRGPEVYMQRRQSSMEFAAGMYVFPGGSVDPGDGQWPRERTGPTPAAWAEVLGTTQDLAAAVVCAAVRETFEECGVLLASPASAPYALVSTAEADWEEDRAALTRHELSLASLLERRDLVLRADLLHPWTHWTTPEFEPRRFDTWFFVAAMPEHGRARDVSGEADLSVWCRPLDALAHYRTGAIDMLPPTLVTLREIALRRDSADVLAAAADRIPLPAPLSARLRPRLGESDPIELVWPVEDPFGAEPFPVDGPTPRIEIPDTPVEQVEQVVYRGSPQS